MTLVTASSSKMIAMAELMKFSAETEVNEIALTHFEQAF